MGKPSKALTQDEVERLLDLVGTYRKEREQKLSELPFFYTVLKEVQVNENAHTKLLKSLIDYKPALLHFVAWIKEKHALDLPVSGDGSPEITTEDDYIDMLIQEGGNYAIIVENKVCGAVDQDQQLGRYINGCVGLGYTETQIYILYLVDRPGKEPSEQTWGNYKESFKRRFLVLSYTEDIIPWMQKFLEELESSKKEDEKLLLSGVTQYLDYLKMTFMNSHHIDMEECLKKYVAGKVSSDKSDKVELSERQIIDALTPDIDALEVLLSDAKRLRARSYIEIWKDAFEAAYKENGGNVSVSKDLTGGALDYPKIRIPYQLNKAPFYVLVEFGVTEKKVYVGLGKHPNVTARQDAALRKKFEKGPSEASLKDSAWPHICQKEKQIAERRGWYGYYNVIDENAITKFRELVDVLEELKATPVPAESAEK